MGLLVLAFLTGCSKNEFNLINGNQPPADSTVTTQAQKNYINRLYIVLTGIKPDTLTAAAALEQLQTNPYSLSVRKGVVESIMLEPLYAQRLWDDVRNDHLDNVDTAYIRYEYNQAVFNYNNSTGNSQLYWQDIVNRMAPLLTIPSEAAAGTISRTEMQQRAIYSPFYDEINMGTENFVVAVFNQLFFRYPTNAELAAAKTMVDGQQSSLFLKPGLGKQDFLAIVFDELAYSEGQVMTVYQKYLFRLPTPFELTELTNAFHTGHNYPALQTTLLASDEYFRL